MSFDQGNILSDNQAITADAGSTNQIDFGAPGTAPGHSNAIRFDVGASHVPIEIVVTEAFNTLTSLTVSFQVDNDSAFGSPTTLEATPAIPLASLVVGYRFKMLCKVPEGASERYGRLFYDVTGTNPTTGKITAGVVDARSTGVV